MASKLFLLLIFSIFAIEINAQYQCILNGTGSTFAAILYNAYIFAYSLVKPEIQITYSATGSGAGITAIEQDDVIWAGSDATLAQSAYSTYPNLQQYPILAGPVIPIYNLPGLPSSPVVNLGRDVLGKIFTEEITMWNDPQIVALNPNFANLLPAAPIIKVVRLDVSGTTQIFVNSLYSMSPSFASQIPYGCSYFPQSFTNGKNFLRGNGNEGVVANVRVFNNSIGYCGYSYILTSPIPYAAVINRAGNLVTQAISGVTAAVDNAVFDQYFNAPLYDLPGNNSWPIAGFSYLMLRTRETTLCTQRREFTKFVNFVLTNPTTIASTIENGFSPFPTSLVSQVLQKIQNITCGPVGAMTVVASTCLIPQHVESVFTALYVLAALGLVMIIGICTYYLIKPGEELSFSEILYILVFSFGIVLGFIAVFFWAASPNNDSICGARQWLSPLALAIVLSALSSRLFQIAMIYRHYTQAKRVTRSKLNLWLFASLGLSVIFQIIILVLWSAIDHYRRVEFVYSALDFEDDAQCNSNYIAVWLGLLVAHIGILIAWSVFVIYLTWSINNQVGSSRWLVMSVYNVLLSLLVVIPLMLRTDNDDRSLSIYIGFGLLFIMTSTALSIFIPKLARAFKKAKSTATSKSQQSNAEGGNEAEFNEVVRVAKKIDKDQK